MMRDDSNFPSLLAGLLLGAALAFLPAGPLAAKPDGTAVFRGRERVTAIDLVVEFEPRPGHEWLYDRRIPKDLAPADFEVLYDGEPRPVIALEKIVDARVQDAEPWQIVLYFDAILTSNRGVRQMASALGERIDALLAFGTVELVWADPWPRTRVPSTRDAADHRRELAELALLGEGRDELLTLRYQLLDELRSADREAPGGGAEMSLAELAWRVAIEEARIVRQRQDALLAYLATRPPGDGKETARRAVFLVHDGFDLEPAAFYGALVDDFPASDAIEDASLTAGTEALARTLAAYGWATFSLALPPPPPPPPGVRLGKWLFTPAKPQRMDPDPRYHIVDPADRHTERRDLRTAWTFIGGIRGRYQERRNPERAQAYLDLGRSLLGQDRIADADDALRRAIYHYADDPKWAAKQAEALIELGRLLELQESQEARHVFAEAYQLDPGLAAVQLGPPASFKDAIAPLSLLARATAGWVVQDGDELDRAIATLGHRVRLTYQVSGPPDGELHPVAVRFDPSGFRLHVPGWARSATPETVAAARARQLLRDPYPAGARRGDLYLEARLEDGGEALALRLEPPASWSGDGDPARLRVTLAFGGPQSPRPAVEHRLFRSAQGDPADAGRPWSSRLALPRPGVEDDPAALAVLVEDLDSGSWGARRIDLALE